MPFNFIFNHNYYSHILQKLYSALQKANDELLNQLLSSLDIKTYLRTMAFRIFRCCSHFILLQHHGLAKGSSQFSRNQYNDSNIKKKQSKQQGI